MIELLDSITGEGATVFDKLRKMGADSGLSREGLLGNLMVLFVAGMDSTSQALSWAFYQLACLPELQEELAAQVKTLPDGVGAAIECDVAGDFAIFMELPPSNIEPITLAGRTVPPHNYQDLAALPLHHEQLARDEAEAG